MRTVFELADELAVRYGNAIGVEVLGYPTCWCHTRAELDRVVAQLRKEGLYV